MESKSDEFFGNAIKMHREKRGWSKNVFAQKLQKAGLEHFHPTTVTRLEDGSRATRLNEAAIIARVLEQSIDSLVNFTYPYEDLRDAIDLYDYCCEKGIWFEKVIDLAEKHAEKSMKDLSEVLDKELETDSLMSDDERELSLIAIGRYREVVNPERLNYWRDHMARVEYEDFLELHYEAISRARESREESHGDD